MPKQDWSKLCLAAGIVQLVFTTPIQIVTPGTLSRVLTVQTQNAVGEMEKLDQTADLQLTSTSPSGEFLNDQGGKLSLTMSKNSANRNFYYRDVSRGNYVITASVTGRSSGDHWQVSQAVIVGERRIQTPDVGAPLTSGVKNPTATPSVKAQPPPAPSLTKEGEAKGEVVTHSIEVKKPVGFWSWLMSLLF